MFYVFWAPVGAIGARIPILGSLGDLFQSNIAKVAAKQSIVISSSGLSLNILNITVFGEFHINLLCFSGLKGDMRVPQRRLGASRRAI